jgi:hypothetical protein
LKACGCEQWLAFVVAASAQSKSSTYESGKIVSVRRLVPDMSSFRGSPSDAPLQASVFTYELSLRVGDSILVARYESGIDYLPATLQPGTSVKIRIKDHRVYLKEPSAEDLEFSVVSHQRLRRRAPLDGSIERFQVCSFAQTKSFSGGSLLNRLKSLRLIYLG